MIFFLFVCTIHVVVYVDGRIHSLYILIVVMTFDVYIHNIRPLCYCMNHCHATKFLISCRVDKNYIIRKSAKNWVYDEIFTKTYAIVPSKNFLKKIFKNNDYNIKRKNEPNFISKINVPTKYQDDCYFLKKKKVKEKIWNLKKINKDKNNKIK